MILGFCLAAYSIIANDSIQTLGTFLSSNEKRPWWILWIFISSILVVTITWGWFSYGGDPAFGRLAAEGKNIPFPPAGITALFVLPPLLLVLFTQKGIPVSTSLLVLTSFKGMIAFQEGEDSKSAISLFEGMMSKSLVGYAIAFVLGIVIYYAVLYVLERRVSEEQGQDVESSKLVKWSILQWFSTGFLWSMWLVQDLANIYCFLPRELTATGLILSLTAMVLLQGYMIRKKGGKIQKIVRSKSNTLDVRSATCIDLLYGVVLLFFKLDILSLFPAKMPMSTTWVFLGLLAGREIGMSLRLRHKGKKQVSNLIFKDMGKAFAGSVVAILLAILLPIIAAALA